MKPTETADLLPLINGVKYNGILGTGTGNASVHPSLYGTSPYQGGYAPVNFAGFKTDNWTGLSKALSEATDPAAQKQAYAAWNAGLIDEAFSLSIATIDPRYVHGRRYMIFDGPCLAT
jgi:hypothetical protein